VDPNRVGYRVGAIGAEQVGEHDGGLHALKLPHTRTFVKACMPYDL
jgi:hypothetical protein